MKYFSIDDELFNPIDRWFLGKVNFNDQWDFWEYVTPGRVKIPNNKLSVTIRKEGIPIDFTMADFELLIINEKVAKLIPPEDVQLIPINIRGYKTDNKYFLMIILDEINCVDENNSVFKKWEPNNDIRPDKAGEFSSINKLIVDPSLIKNRSIFRLKKHNSTIIINQFIKHQFENNNISGVRYTDITL